MSGYNSPLTGSNALHSLQFPDVISVTYYSLLCHVMCYITCYCKSNLIQNSQAVKKVCGPQKGNGEKRCEIQGGDQEMAVMVG